MNHSRNKIINLEIKITDQDKDITYTVVDYDALTILIHHILSSHKIPDGNTHIYISSHDNHLLPAETTQAEALARTATFFGKSSFIPYLDNLGNEIAQLYKYKTGDDFPMLTTKIQKMYGCLTEIVLTQCAHLVNKKPEEIKKITLAGFVHGKEIIEVYKKGAIFRDDGDSMHGVFSHHIHCGWLAAFLSEIGLPKERQCDFYTNYFIRMSEKGTFLRDTIATPFQYAFDLNIVHSYKKDVLCTHGSPAILNDDLIKGSFEKHYPDKQGIKVLSAYIRHRYFDKFYQSDQIMNALFQYMYPSCDVVETPPTTAYPPLHHQLKKNISQSIYCTVDDTESGSIVETPPTTAYPPLHHQLRENISQSTYCIMNDTESETKIMIEIDLFNINNQYDRWSEKYRNDNQVTIKRVNTEIAPHIYNVMKVATLKKISPHDMKMYNMTLETALSRHKSVIKEKPMPKIETINKIREIIQDVENRPSSLLAQVNSQTMSRSSVRDTLP